MLFKCAECAIDLCADCLAHGTPAPEAPGPPGGHTAAHGYRVADNAAAFTLFEADWSAADELALLEGVDVYGMGNWRDIAAYVGGGKTEAAAARHYLAAYLLSPTAPLPSPVVIAPAGGGAGDAVAAAAAAGEGGGGAPAGVSGGDGGGGGDGAAHSHFLRSSSRA